ncbi:hypothetical protein EV199_1138 [Pseudobacter ginsenosidimutans]|uniref:Uncharacterized protein n=1 Tax=Pseudobacter ginsenosidimutans TaxID=661488 RepID=A0A4Q7N3E1_9BACT|nr:hypothetical protein EV199_1138 [Pseudobacter ginsenosidimutans]
MQQAEILATDINLSMDYTLYPSRHPRIPPSYLRQQLNSNQTAIKVQPSTNQTLTIN